MVCTCTFARIQGKRYKKRQVEEQRPCSAVRGVEKKLLTSHYFQTELGLRARTRSYKCILYMYRIMYTGSYIRATVHVQYGTEILTQDEIQAARNGKFL